MPSGPEILFNPNYLVVREKEKGRGGTVNMIPFLSTRKRMSCFFLTEKKNVLLTSVTTLIIKNKEIKSLDIFIKKAQFSKY